MRLQRLRPPLRVRVVLVAAINDDVARFEQRGELPDQLVDGDPRLHKHHDFAGPFERFHQVGHAVAADKLLARRAALNERFDLVDAAIEHGHAIPAALHVQCQIFAHYRQADQSEIAIRAHEFVRKKKREIAATGTARPRIHPGPRNPQT